MPVVDLLSLPRSGVLIGLDPGTKTIGVAASDPTRLLVTPVETIRRGKTLQPSLDRLFALVYAREAVALIVGLPLNMDGSTGPRAQSVRTLVSTILKQRDLVIAFQDERLSSAEAEHVMQDSGIARRKQAARIDAEAAAVILRDAMNRLEQAS